VPFAAGGATGRTGTSLSAVSGTTVRTGTCLSAVSGATGRIGTCLSAVSGATWRAGTSLSAVSGATGRQGNDNFSQRITNNNCCPNVERKRCSGSVLYSDFRVPYFGSPGIPVSVFVKIFSQTVKLSNPNIRYAALRIKRIKRIREPSPDPRTTFSLSQMTKTMLA